MLVYTRHGLSLSRGYCLSSNGTRTCAPCTGVYIESSTSTRIERPRAPGTPWQNISSRRFPAGIRPRVVYYFLASRICDVKKQDFPSRCVDQLTTYDQSRYIVSLLGSFRLYGSEFPRCNRFTADTRARIFLGGPARRERARFQHKRLTRTSISQSVDYERLRRTVDYRTTLRCRG